jgi:C1A family cysteine protease
MKPFLSLSQTSNRCNNTHIINISKKLLVLAILILAGASTFAQQLSKENFSLKTASESIQINQLVADNKQEINIQTQKELAGLSIDAAIELQSERAFVRVILVDDNYNEYLVYETNTLLSDEASFNIENMCEETFYLKGVKAIYLRVELEEAQINLSRVLLSDASKLKKAIGDNEITAQKQQQEQEKIELINSRIEEKGMLWSAEQTALSQLSYSEKKKRFGGELPNLYGFEYYAGGIFELPGTISNSKLKSAGTSPYVPEFSWTNKHGSSWVTGTRNQGGCGSCWAFSAVGVTEVLANLYFNQHINFDLSEQDILSCSSSGSCSGGNPGSALNYIASTGVVNETCFPYTATDQPCGNKCSNPSEQLQIAGKVNYYQSYGEDTLKKWLLDGPVNLSIIPWWHALTCVGYKTLQVGDYIYVKTNSVSRWVTIDASSPYVGRTAWYLKNSWGSGWGDGGYAYVLTNVSDLYLTYKPYGPVTSLNYSDADIQCIDADGDGYYTWGSGTKPSHCPSCPDEADGDDSNPLVGPWDEFGYPIDSTYDLPAPWETSDVGAVAAQGSAGYDAGVFTVSGSGADIWGSYDEFRYVYQPISGDVTITARVASQQNTHEWAKAGVMIRESLDPDAKHAATILTAENGNAMQFRAQTGGETVNTAFGPQGVPYWVRIKRKGNIIISYLSTYGDVFIEVGREEIGFSDEVLVGLAVTSHADGILSQVTFENVSIEYDNQPAYVIQNRWTNEFVFDSNDRLRYSHSFAPGDDYYLWYLEDLGNGITEIKNKATNEYMHIENQYGYVQNTVRTPGWYSSQWYIENVDDTYKRIQSRWLPGQYMHVENLQDHVQYGAIDWDWWSAQWLIEEENVAIEKYATTGSKNSNNDAYLYPNPAENGIVHVVIPGLSEFATISVFDFTGRIVLEQLAEENTVNLDVRAFQSGIYLIRVKEGSKESELKFIVK